MKGLSLGSGLTRRPLRPLAWAALPVVALSIGVFSSGVGIDVLYIAVAGLFLLGLERTVGDWLADVAGPVPATIIFALVIVGFSWSVIDYSNTFLIEAEKRGYRTAYYQTSAAAVSPDSSDSSEAPAAGAGPRTARSSSSSSAAPGAGGAVDRQAASTTASAVEESSRRGENDKQGADTTSKRSQEGVRSDTVSVSKIVFGSPSSVITPASTSITLSMPASAALARSTKLEGVVTADGNPVTEGVVDFIINGTSVGRGPVDSRGAASTTFATHIAGTYEVRARFSGTVRYQPSVSGIRRLSVVR